MWIGTDLAASATLDRSCDAANVAADAFGGGCGAGGCVANGFATSCLWLWSLAVQWWTRQRQRFCDVTSRICHYRCGGHLRVIVCCYCCSIWSRDTRSVGTWMGIVWLVALCCHAHVDQIASCLCDPAVESLHQRWPVPGTAAGWGCALWADAAIPAAITDWIINSGEKRMNYFEECRIIPAACVCDIPRTCYSTTAVRGAANSIDAPTPVAGAVRAADSCAPVRDAAAPAPV